MMPENGHIEIFERYRNGDLTEAELREFEARLAYDSEFKEDFDAYEQLELGIKAHFRNDLKLKLKELDETMDTPTSQRTSIKKMVIWSSSIAASILIGVMLFQHFSSNSSVQLAEQYWPQERGIPVKMGPKDRYDNAMNAFKLGEFDKASEILQKLSSDTSDYFLGIIAYEQGDNLESKRYFSQIKKNSIFYNTARFRLALIYLAEADLLSARKIFNSQIVENTEFAEASREILEKI